jgi:hypothetical protein
MREYVEQYDEIKDARTSAEVLKAYFSILDSENGPDLEVLQFSVARKLASLDDPNNSTQFLLMASNTRTQMRTEAAANYIVGELRPLPNQLYGPLEAIKTSTQAIANILQRFSANRV